MNILVGRGHKSIRDILVVSLTREGSSDAQSKERSPSPRAQIINQKGRFQKGRFDVVIATATFGIGDGIQMMEQAIKKLQQAKRIMATSHPKFAGSITGLKLRENGVIVLQKSFGMKKLKRILNNRSFHQKGA